ncbi:hypothetical protein [Streptomyces sp. NPDC093594]|uniref:hypothetical protein n=1 Tax=Streptomyces sp. NPDC093594 TaxID=3155305 RepID=UPI003450A703
MISQYMSGIWNWQPADMRPDPTRVRGKVRLWRQEWAAACGEIDRAAALAPLPAQVP